MKTLNENIIEQLQSKHDAFLGTKGEENRQAFKNGLAWAIDTIETLTEIDKCEKEHEAEQLLIQRVSNSDKFRIKQTGVNEFVVQKNYNEKETKGMLWWKETTTVNRWIRVDKYGVKLFIYQYINNIADLVEFKTKDEAKEWIDNYRKYPIYHYC